MALKRMSRREWSRQAERATLREEDGRLRRAQKAFRAIRLPELQMQIAREIVETRARELCLAYETVVMLAVGNKTRRGKHGVTRVLRLPCVIFVVRRKWRGRGGTSHRLQSLPQHLLAYATIDGQRVLCAVPTDVVSEGGMYGARPQAPSGLQVSMGGLIADGSAFCAARLRVGNTQSAVMVSCQHVFTPSLQIAHPAPVGGSQVTPFDAPQTSVALTSRHGGQLRADGKPSFDVQLADVTSPNAALWRRTLNGLNLSPGHEFITTAESFDAIAGITQFRIIVSPNITDESTGARRRSPIFAKWFRTWERLPGLQYPMRSASGIKSVLVFHRVLLMFRLLGGAQTIGGDSGSAIVMFAPDGRDTLVGMHIAGGIENGLRWSLAIPAWFVFDRFHYSALPPGATLTPFNP